MFSELTHVFLKQFLSMMPYTEYSSECIGGSSSSDD